VRWDFFTIFNVLLVINNHEMNLKDSIL